MKNVGVLLGETFKNLLGFSQPTEKFLELTCEKEHLKSSLNKEEPEMSRNKEINRGRGYLVQSPKLITWARSCVLTPSTVFSLINIMIKIN